MEEGENIGHDEEIQINQDNQGQATDANATGREKTEYRSVLLRLDTALTEKVDYFRADRGFSNRTEAIRYLMTLGLKEADSEGALRLRVARVEDALKTNGLL